MKELRKVYFSIQTSLFPVPEEEKIEIFGKIKEFVELIKAVKPSRFPNDLLLWTGLGRPMKDREAIIRALMLKYVYKHITWVSRSHRTVNFLKPDSSGGWRFAFRGNDFLYWVPLFIQE